MFLKQVNIGINYLDDFDGAEVSKKADISYRKFKCPSRQNNYLVN